MREILFRGKRTDNGRWVYGYLSFIYYDVPQKARIYDPESVCSHDVLTETTGQYLGFTDKNGKKIFEGDIIKHYLHAENWRPFGFDIGKVFWQEENCTYHCTSIEKKNEAFKLWKENAYEYEVIGNIYDTPELLDNHSSLEESKRTKPLTVSNYIHSISDEELAKMISNQFCHGYGVPQLLDWLKSSWSENEV